ncbi:hypothetical protein H5410_030961 [Solanum commersonii]|uniref:Uncharacterized protein n=1 Tax=Solanum commersonii TaxID=4109 RepID=A0A9J5YIG4_SOLCO|nr:hypothetical protein H5410_030961 [Solanum commersonii]
MHFLRTYTFEQSRQNWIIKNTSRPTGSIIDYVYNFILHGEVSETKKKLSKNEETMQHIRGNKLIKHYVVGTCTESCKGVDIKNRGEVNYLSNRGIPSNIEKRENGDLYGQQQVKLSNDATHVYLGYSSLSTPVQFFFYLWDFELIDLQQRSIEVFPIPYIDELQGVDSSIDLLSSLPKASGKRPRDSVPTEVGLISSAHVVMESQTLTTTPLVVDGASEPSLSMPATT